MFVCLQAKPIMHYKVASYVWQAV